MNAGMAPLPRVSVVIPTKDRWPLLRVALRSVLDQTLADIEVIVIDDGSSDDTAEQLRRIADPRLVVVAHATSTGVVRARNDGIARSRAAWIAFLDDDDFWAPQKLEQQLTAADRDAVAVMATTGALRIVPDGSVLENVIPPGGHDLEHQLLASNVVGGPSTVMATAVALQESGGFDERLSVLADWDLWLRLADRGSLVVVDEPLTAILDHGANMQRVDIGRVGAELEYMRARHAARLRALHGDFGSATLSAWMASNLLREGRRRAAARWYLDAAQRSRAPSHVVAAAAALLGERVVERVRSRRREEAQAAPAWVLAALSVG